MPSTKESRSQRSPGRRPHNIHRNHAVFRHPLSGKPDVADPAALRLLLLELVENQVPKRIEDHSVSIAFHWLRDVWMMPHHHARSRVDSRMRELLLLGIGP